MADSDKGNTPEGSTDGAQGGDSSKGTNEPSTREIELSAALEAERLKVADATAQASANRRNYDNLRGAYGRQSAQVGQYRELYGDIDGGGESNARPASHDAGSIDDMAPNPTDSKLGLIGFRQTHTDLDSKEKPDGLTIAQEVDGLLAGETKGEFAAFTRDPMTGKVKLDVEKTLRNAYKDVKLQRFERAQAVARQAKAESDTEAAKFRRLGVISGDGSVDVPEDLDLENMTPEEMVEKGLVNMDPDDPVKAARNPRKRT